LSQQTSQSQNIQQQIDQLHLQIEEFNYQYYVLDDPTVRYAEYDRAMRKLSGLEQNHHFFFK